MFFLVFCPQEFHVNIFNLAVQCFLRFSFTCVIYFSFTYKYIPSPQLRFKPLPITIACPESDQPYFGKQDMNHNKMFEKRAQARKLFEDQLNAVAEKKRSAILNDLKAQREESMMLTRAKTEYVFPSPHH